MVFYGTRFAKAARRPMGRGLGAAAPLRADANTIQNRARNRFNLQVSANNLFALKASIGESSEVPTDFAGQTIP